MAACRDCACFPVCHECFFRGFNADGCPYLVAKRQAAHWITGWAVANWAECSNCHEAVKLSEMDHKRFCPACGARMEE